MSDDFSKKLVILCVLSGDSNELKMEKLYNRERLISDDDAGEVISLLKKSNILNWCNTRDLVFKGDYHRESENTLTNGDILWSYYLRKVNKVKNRVRVMLKSINNDDILVGASYDTEEGINTQCMVTGKVKYGEKVIDAVKREVMEEIGIPVIKYDIFGSTKDYEMYRITFYTIVYL